MNRREFFGKLTRGTILLGLTAGGAWLGLREPDKNACNLDFICRNCVKNSSCELPEADNYRKDMNNNFRR